MSVAPGNSTTSADAVYSLPVAALKTGKTYIIMAAGVAGGSPGFGLFINENGRSRALTAPMWKQACSMALPMPRK
ncbi:MAG: hypothetical protein IPJ82_12640 [Lewinellaceae bacterium]|nr:hypothetical protein [Lewinellaceae bacterium]